MQAIPTYAMQQKLHSKTIVMKGTKVLTLGAGREKDVDADGPLASYTHAIHVYLRMRGTVNWWAGWSFY